MQNVSRTSCGGSQDNLAAYFLMMERYPALSEEETAAAFKKMREKNSLTDRQKIIVHNWRLVIGFARREQRPGLLLDDLVQAGNEGLIDAVDLFDERRGWKFSTYASIAIKRSISRLVQNRQVIRVPESAQKKYRKFSKDKERSLCETMEFDPDTWIEKNRGKNKKDLGQLIAFMNNTLDKRLPSVYARTKGGVPLENWMVSLRDQKAPIDILDSKEASEDLTVGVGRIFLIIDVLLSQINVSKRDIDMFKMHYGLDAGGGRTRAQLCRQYGVKRQTVSFAIRRVIKELHQFGLKESDIQKLSLIATELPILSLRN